MFAELNTGYRSDRDGQQGSRDVGIVPGSVWRQALCFFAESYPVEKGQTSLNHVSRRAGFSSNITYPGRVRYFGKLVNCLGALVSGGRHLAIYFQKHWLRNKGVFICLSSACYVPGLLCARPWRGRLGGDSR